MKAGESSLVHIYRNFLEPGLLWDKVWFFFSAIKKK